MTLPARAVATATPSLAQERAAIARGDDLGGGLARAVRIVAAERLVLAVRPGPLAVAVDLVGRDVDDRAHASAAPRSASSRCAVPIVLVANVASGSR